MSLGNPSRILPATFAISASLLVFGTEKQPEMLLAQECEVENTRRISINFFSLGAVQAALSVITGSALNNSAWGPYPPQRWWGYTVTAVPPWTGITDSIYPMVSPVGGVFLSHLPLLHAVHPLLPGSHSARGQGGHPLLPHT